MRFSVCCRGEGGGNGTGEVERREMARIMLKYMQQ